MPNPISAVKNHVEQNKHNVRDLAIAAGALTLSTFFFLKFYNVDRETINLKNQ